MSLDVHLIVPPTRPNAVYWANITHNLSVMAGKAGIYEHLWRPGENGITKAGELIKPLTRGLAKLRAEPAYYRQFDPKNGWGAYEDLVYFVEMYLAACRANPHADISVSR